MNWNSEKIRALSDKDYILAVMATTVFIGINFIFMSLVPVYTVESGYSEFHAGLQNTLFSAFSVIFRFYLGPMADRKGRKNMMLLGSSAFVLGPLIFVFSQGIFLFILLGRLVMAVGMAAFLSAVSCHIAETIVPEHRGLAIGVQRASHTTALMLGPFLGLMIAESDFGFSGLFLFTVGLGVMCFSFVMGVREKPFEREENRQLKKDMMEVLKKRVNLKIYYALIHLSLAFGTLLSYAALYLGRFQEVANPGSYFTVYALGGLFGSVTTGILSDRMSKALIAKPLMMAMGAGLAILSVAALDPVIISVVSGVIAGICFSGGLAVLVSWLVEVTPAHQRGTALGLQENCIDGGIAVGSLVFGVLTMAFTYQQAFLFLGLLGFLTPIFIKSGE